MGGDEHVFVRGYLASDYSDYVAASGSAQAVGNERLVEAAVEQGLEAVLPVEHLDEPRCGHSCISTGGPSLAHVIGQPFHDALLLGLIDDLLVHRVRSERPPALLRLHGRGRGNQQGCQQYFHCPYHSYSIYLMIFAGTSPMTTSFPTVIFFLKRVSSLILPINSYISGVFSAFPVLTYSKNSCSSMS